MAGTSPGSGYSRDRAVCRILFIRARIVSYRWLSSSFSSLSATRAALANNGHKCVTSVPSSTSLWDLTTSFFSFSFSVSTSFTFAFSSSLSFSRSCFAPDHPSLSSSFSSFFLATSTTSTTTMSWGLDGLCCSRSSFLTFFLSSSTRAQSTAPGLS